MENKALKSQALVPKAKKLLNRSLLTFNLPLLVEKLKHLHCSVEGELNAMVLLKCADKQIILTSLPAETEIKSFQSDDSVTVQIIEGKLRFHTLNETVTLSKGKLLTLHENIKYSMKTKENTVFLLTIENAKKLPTIN